MVAPRLHESNQVINPAFYRATALSESGNGDFAAAYESMSTYIDQGFDRTPPCDDTWENDFMRVGGDLTLLTDLSILSGNQDGCRQYWEQFNTRFPGFLLDLEGITDPSAIGSFVVAQLSRFQQVRFESPITNFPINSPLALKKLYLEDEGHSFTEELLQMPIIFAAASIIVPQALKPQVYSAYLESRVYAAMARLSMGKLPTTGELIALNQLAGDEFVGNKIARRVSNFVIACQKLHIDNLRLK